MAPPVKQAALALDLPVYQWPSLRKPEALAALADLKADLFLVAAYGLYIPDEVVDLPARGCLNLHPSLLPRHRGASPVASAILAGDAETGVTVLFVTPEMDAGDILAQARTPIGPEETTGALTARLGEWGAGVYVDAVTAWLHGDLQPRPQDAGQATSTRLWTRDDGRLDWRKDASELARQVRAFDPWPGTHTTWKGELLGVLAAAPAPRLAGRSCAGDRCEEPAGDCRGHIRRRSSAQNGSGGGQARRGRPGVCQRREGICGSRSGRRARRGACPWVMIPPPAHGL